MLDFQSYDQKQHSLFKCTMITNGTPPISISDRFFNPEIEYMYRIIPSLQDSEKTQPKFVKNAVFTYF